MKLSIITINFNNAEDLKKTINSVVQQTWRQFEYIIIDGGSTDGSLEIIQHYASDLSYWVSEKDDGIFHAMNKGVNKAAGEYLLMLNAGDLLCENTILENIFSLDECNEDILIGDAYISVNDKIIGSKVFTNSISFNFFRKPSLSHQAAFIKKELHDIVGMYDEELAYGSDWKFFILAICKHNVSYRHLPFFVSICDAGGLTYNTANFFVMSQEREYVLQQYFPSFLSDYRKLDYMEKRLLKNIIKNLWPSTKAFIKKLL